VLFGTDYPLAKHKDELERFYALGLTEEENSKILFENAKRLLKLDI
jgi:predicted TIM-barrel fold metal-dependent hydrolase